MHAQFILFLYLLKKPTKSYTEIFNYLLTKIIVVLIFTYIEHNFSFLLDFSLNNDLIIFQVVLWSIGVVGTSAVVVGVLSRYLARRRAKPILNPRIQRAINKRISRMRSPNGGKPLLFCMNSL